MNDAENGKHQFTAEQAELLRDLTEIIGQDPRALRWYVNAYRWGGGTMWLIKNGGPIVGVAFVLGVYGIDIMQALKHVAARILGGLP